jgi:hypothetical protein
MKVRLITAALILGGFAAATSQEEYDDVYFTKKDRVARVSVPIEKPQNSLNALSETNAAYQAVAPSVSMAGYTGRTINPDYQPGATATVASSYFTPNYQPARVNNQLNSYSSNFNNFSNCCYNPYNSYYGRGFGNRGYYSPYGMNSWGYSPYSSFGGGYYSPFNSGFGYSPFGFGNGFSIFSGMGYGYSMYSGMGNGWGGGYYGNGYGGGYYPGNVIVVNNPDSHINKVYGKRQSRSTDNANLASNYTGRGNGINSSADPNQGGNRGGRVASSGTSNAYYQRGWRQDPTISQTTTSTNSGSRFTGYSGGSNSSRSTWGSFDSTPSRGTSGGIGNSSFGTSRSSGFSSGGSFGGSSGSSSGGRSSGSSSGGGSSGGTRGRN